MLKDDIFNITSQAQFESTALQVYEFQYANNIVYKRFCDLLNRKPNLVKTIKDIPFLPIQFFKSETILSSAEDIDITFTSSGTTGQNTSKHHVTDLDLYERSFNTAFKQFYGDIETYVVLALLPSYLERQGSSLIYMAEHLIKVSNHAESGFYLDDISALIKTLKELESRNQKCLLIGVSFALLDLVETETLQLKNTIVMETGGMKGRRKEMIREELHAQLKQGFGVSNIHSEYGMTELLSQAYSKGRGIFECPSHMDILIRDTEDALSFAPKGKTGGINVIDLANLNSCSFIATQDLGKQIDNDNFEILGRFDHSDIRGCNLMVL